MAFAQHAVDCPVHGPSCCLVVGTQDGVEVWRSHLDAAVPPEVRLNLDHPECDDRRPGRSGTLRYRLPSAAEAAGLGLDDEGHRRLAVAAERRGLASAAAVQAATGQSVAALRQEAARKGW